MLFPFDSEAVKNGVEAVFNWQKTLDHQTPPPRRWSGRLRRELEAEAIAASTALEGVPVTAADVRRILAGDSPAGISPRDLDLVRGYRDAMQYVHDRADDKNFRWSRELICAVHHPVLARARDLGAGRLRTTPVSVVKDGATIYRPPDAELVPSLVDQMCDQMDGLDPNPATAAWLHATFAAIHPFSDGNGRSARILTSLVMLRAGFRRPIFTSLEEWWGRNSQDYYGSFDCLGDVFDPKRDSTPFVATHLKAQTSQIAEFVQREDRDRQLWTILENLLVDRKMPARLTHALWECFFGRPVTAGYYRGMTDVSTATATNDLSRATAAELLIASGERRGRTYTAHPKLYEQLFSVLHILDPSGNREQWPKAVLDELMARAERRVGTA